jgi:uncharacterized protein (TIGR02996 family)
VTTEDDFQLVLDKNLDDWQTRLVFADWLQEREDPRAEGYRALGTLRRYPGPPIGYLRNVPRALCFYGSTYGYSSNSNYPNCILPDAWFIELRRTYVRHTSLTDHANHMWVWVRSRRAIEDAAALTFRAAAPELKALFLSNVPCLPGSSA